VQGKIVGRLGEIHPAVLANWGIQMPCAALELELDGLAGG
jgi:phenylalanyl-tRNA synthetase beta chain